MQKSPLLNLQDSDLLRIISFLPCDQLCFARAVSKRFSMVINSPFAHPLLSLTQNHLSADFVKHKVSKYLSLLSNNQQQQQQQPFINLNCSYHCYNGNEEELLKELTKIAPLVKEITFKGSLIDFKEFEKVLKKCTGVSKVTITNQSVDCVDSFEIKLLKAVTPLAPQLKHLALTCLCSLKTVLDLLILMPHLEAIEFSHLENLDYILKNESVQLSLIPFMKNVRSLNIGFIPCSEFIKQLQPLHFFQIQNVHAENEPLPDLKLTDLITIHGDTLEELILQFKTSAPKLVLDTFLLPKKHSLLPRLKHFYLEHFEPILNQNFYRILFSQSKFLKRVTLKNEGYMNLLETIDSFPNATHLTLYQISRLVNFNNANNRIIITSQPFLKTLCIDFPMSIREVQVMLQKFLNLKTLNIQLEIDSATTSILKIFETSKNHKLSCLQLSSVTVTANSKSSNNEIEKVEGLENLAIKSLQVSCYAPVAPFSSLLRACKQLEQLQFKIEASTLSNSLELLAMHLSPTIEELNLVCCATGASAVGEGGDDDDEKASKKKASALQPLLDKLPNLTSLTLTSDSSGDFKTLSLKTQSKLVRLYLDALYDKTIVVPIHEFMNQCPALVKFTIPNAKNLLKEADLYKRYKRLKKVTLLIDYENLYTSVTYQPVVVLGSLDDKDVTTIEDLEYF